MLELAHFVTKWTFRSSVDRVWYARHGTRLFHSQSLSNDLYRLGPAYVKFGQFLSTRRDILPNHVIQDLRTLQSHVPYDPIDPHPFIREAFPSANFDVEYNPIATASIACVYRGTWNGKPCVFKIKRSQVTERMEHDISTILTMSKWIDRTETLFTQDSSQFSTTCAHFANGLRTELDFEREARSLRFFRKQVMERFEKWVRVPQVYAYSDDILVLEYLPSQPIDRYRSPKLADRLMRIFLTSVIEWGGFHSDLHAGNIGLDTDEKLVFYDFGSYVFLETSTQEGFERLAQLVFVGEETKIVDQLFSMQILDANAKREDANALVRALLGYLNRLDMNGIVKELKAVETKPLLLSESILSLSRALVTLEGVCLTVSPSFNVTSNVMRYVEEEYPEEVWSASVSAASNVFVELCQAFFL